MADKSSREKVEDLHKKGKSAKEIAESLEMSQANVYAHLRKIGAEAGEAPRKRGRPPKVQTDGDTPKAETKTESKPSTRPAPGKPAASKSAPAKAETNGHAPDYFAHTVEGLDRDLVEARKRVTMLEKMRESLVGSAS